MKTLVISAFPGCGKTHLYNTYKDHFNILDSDSSKFDKKYFPKNYINHIKKNLGVADLILVSSHKVVRDALVENGIEFTLVYPDKSIKDEYIQRYIDRGNQDTFVELLKTNWDEWISECEEQENCINIFLESGEYLMDIMEVKIDE